MAYHYGHNVDRLDPETFITVSDGDVFEKCNLNQAQPDTIVFAGKKNLKFINCPLINCALPSDSTIDEDCNTTKVIFTNPFKDNRTQVAVGKRAHTKMTDKEREDALEPHLDRRKEIFIHPRYVRSR